MAISGHDIFGKTELPFKVFTVWYSALSFDTMSVIPVSALYFLSPKTKACRAW